MAVARELGITEVVVPYFPGGFSAFGMIASRSRVEYSQATMASFAQLGPDEFNRVVDELEVKCRQDLEAQGIDPSEITIERAYYAMYTGQGQDNRLPLPDGRLDAAALEGVSEEFHSFYDRRFGYRAPEIPIFVSSLSVVGLGPRPKIVLPGEEGEDVAPERNPERAVISRSELHIDGGSRADSAFYDRAKLVEGDEVEGPAVIDDRLGTIVINTDAVARVAHHGTLRIEV